MPPTDFACAMPTPDFETLLYRTAGAVATITLNRPEQLNTIVPPMPDEIEAAVGLAERDPDIKVVVLRGAGRAFSAGYDFGGGFRHWGELMMTDGKWDPGKDFAIITAHETGPTQKFMAIWRASKPVIAQVHGWCVGGASDYALLADIVLASDDAVIGTADSGAGAQSRPDQRGGALRAPGISRRRDRRRAGADPAVAIAGAEADRQP